MERIPTQRFRVGMLFLGILASSNAVHGEPVAEMQYSMPAETAEDRALLLNPALYSEKSDRIGILAGRSSRNTALTFGEEDVKVEARAKTDMIGLTSHAPLPEGLSVGAFHYRTFTETELSRTDRTNKPRETFAGFYTGGRLTLDLSQNIRLGILMRHLTIHNVVAGSFDTSSRSRIKGSMTGLGSGLAFSFPTAQVSMVYYQPMQGKTEILREEKRLVRPGLVQVGGDFRPNEKMGMGLAITRYFYRRDDLAEPTTADDANETQVDLRGLDPNRFLFPYQRIFAGFSLNLSEKAQFILAIGQVNAQAIDDNAVLPDANNDRLEKFSYNQTKAGVKLTNGAFTLNIIGMYQKYSRNFGQSSFISDSTASQSERGLGFELGLQL